MRKHFPQLQMGFGTKKRFSYLEADMLSHVWALRSQHFYNIYVAAADKVNFTFLPEHNNYVLANKYTQLIAKIRACGDPAKIESMDRAVYWKPKSL